jgi:hypothetical protein
MSAFFLQGKTTLQNHVDTKDTVYLEYKRRLVGLLNKFFRVRSQIHAIFLEFSSTNILKDRAEYAVLIDSNKLFLFSAVEHSTSEGNYSGLSGNWMFFAKIKKNG